MSSLDQIANVVRSVRLGALALILSAAVGSSWAASQPGRAHLATPAKPAGITSDPAQVNTWQYAVTFGDGNLAGAADSQTVVAVCLDSVTRNGVNC